MSEEKIDLVADVTNKKTGLTEREEYFLDILFDKHRGNVRAAMDDAGYPKGTATREVATKLKDHIVLATKAYMASQTAKASISVVSVLDDPTAPGQTQVLKAAKEILDRTGVQTEEKTEKTVERNIVVLPPKGRVTIEAEGEE